MLEGMLPAGAVTLPPNLLDAVIEGTPDLIFAKDVQGRFILVNSACARLLNRSRSELYGKVISDFLDAAAAQQVEGSNARVLRTGESVITEQRFSKDGEIRIYLATKSPLKSASGEVIGVICVAQDITERKRMEDALGESEARYRLLAEAMPQLVWMSDSAGALQYCNRYFQEVTGLTFDEARERGEEVIHPEDRDEAKRKWREALHLGETYDIDYRILNFRAGSYTWFSARVHPIKDRDGKVRRWIGTAIDIDARKKAALEIAKREEQLRLAQQAGDVGTWTWDKDSGEAHFSTAYYDWLGLDPAIVKFSREIFRDHVVPEDRQRVADAFEREPVEQLRVEYRIKKGNEVRWLLSLGRGMETSAGQTRLLAGVTLDITAQKQAEEDMARQTMELTRSNTDLQRFSSIASHDLQQPLRNMAICSELLNRNYRHLLDESARQLLDLIYQGARSGQALTQALLSYARTVGTEAFKPVPVNLNDALDQALLHLKSAIAESKAIITRDDLPVVAGDGIQIVQLFQNLVENSIKYRSDAPPRVHLASAREEDCWLISITDNGIGVPAGDRERIFEPFQRLRNPNVSGSGLRLATCRRIVERNRGRIWVEDGIPSGTRFLFTLPAVTELSPGEANFK